MVANMGAAHCGPGTSWDKHKHKCLPVQRSEGEVQTCKAFTRGVHNEGARVGSLPHVLNASHCARGCLEKFHAESFTFKEGTRDCYCYNDATPKPAQEHPTCEIQGGSIKVVCNGDVVASYTDGTDRRALESCNAQAARGQWLACNVSVSGQTCNAEPTCDPKTTKVIDGRCVARKVAESMSVDGISSSVRINNAACVADAPAMAAISVKTEAECARRCEISDRCRASVYESELKHCYLTDTCPSLRVTKGKAVTFHTHSASPENCGPGTRLHATTHRCELDHNIQEQLKDQSVSLQRIADQKNECESRFSKLKHAYSSIENDAKDVKAKLLSELNKCTQVREMCAISQRDAEATKVDTENKLMVAVGGAASAEKQALLLRVQLANANKQTSESKQKLIASQTELRNLATAISKGAPTTSTARMLAIQELAKAQAG